LAESVDRTFSIGFSGMTIWGSGFQRVLFFQVEVLEY